MTSRSGSYLSTWSPGFLSHLPIVPSATLSPSCGIVTLATGEPPSSLIRDVARVCLSASLPASRWIERDAIMLLDDEHAAGPERRREPAHRNRDLPVQRHRGLDEPRRRPRGWLRGRAGSPPPRPPGRVPGAR